MPRWKELFGGGCPFFQRGFFNLSKSYRKLSKVITTEYIAMFCAKIVQIIQDKIFSNVYRFHAWPFRSILLSYFQTRKAVASGTIKKATNYQHSNFLFVGLNQRIPKRLPGGLKARQCHHQGIVPSGGKNLPDHTKQSGACHPPRHRGCLGPWRSGYPPAVFWVHGFQHQRKTHEFRIHRPDRWQIAASAEVFRGCQFLIAPQRVFGFFLWRSQCNE